MKTDLPKLTGARELEALAVCLERRAARRFRAMAEAMAARGRADLEQLFLRLAAEEVRHETAIREAAPDLEEELIEQRWPANLGPAPGAPDAEQLARSSVYQCLAEAVRNEETAFRFYSYLAAQSDDPDLTRRAEALAKEELAHAALLRNARRAAYRREPPAGWLTQHKVSSLEDLRAAAGPHETALLRRLARSGLDAAKAAALTQTTDRILQQLTSSAETNKDPSEPAADEGHLRALDQEIDEAFDFYDRVARSATEEAVMLAAQELAGLALERITILAGGDQPTG